jgi:hypothetical protein
VSGTRSPRAAHLTARHRASESGRGGRHVRRLRGGVHRRGRWTRGGADRGWHRPRGGR